RDRLLNLNTLITDFGAIIERNVADGVSIRRHFQDELWNCRVDPVQAEMALLNLLSNASDAIGGVGEVTIETDNVISSADRPLAPGLEPGEYIRLAVTDTGRGFDRSQIDRVFDPFFSTKEVGKGTGLGLSMVYGFVRQSGGGVLAENVEGQGARVAMFFPRARGIVEPEKLQTNQTRGQGERILMVEDQEEIAQLGRAILEDLGYDVVQCPSASKAIDLLDHDSNFRLIFTDIVMPGGINGVELAKEVRRRMPAMPILLTTGYSDRALDAESAAFDLVRKPYRRAELAQRIRTLLEGPNGVV
ncbi:MAG TPA: response regulator, partial [Sphingomonas sp.]|nr:response regulator [Sphingomonas sp.]